MPSTDWSQLAGPVVLIVAMLAMFWGILLRPAQMRQKKHQELIKGLVVGDRVVTAGGIYGRVTDVRENTVALEIAKGVTVTFDRRAIRRLQDQEDA